LARQQKSHCGTFPAAPIPQNTKSPVLTCVNFPFLSSPLLEHFGSIAHLSRASVQELLPFLPRAKAAQLVSSLRLATVALREERARLVIDTPLAVAELCAEMRFLSHESLRVILLNTKQELIKIVSVSQGTLNEALAHPREVFKPVIAFSAYAFIMVHNLCGATHKLCYVQLGAMCSGPG
jgi:DNA repair protein RadC